MVAKRADPSSARREQILHAAFVCFARKGFHQTKMQDISATAGISVGLIYRYFSNKEDVVRALAENYLAEMADAFARAEAATTLAEALELIFAHECSQDPGGLTSHIAVDLIAESARAPVLAEVLERIDTAFHQQMVRLFARAGDFLRQVGIQEDAEELAILVHAYGDGLMVRDVILAGSLSVEERMELQCRRLRAGWKLILRGAEQVPLRPVTVGSPSA